MQFECNFSWGHVIQNSCAAKMTHMIHELGSWFWDDDFWLPPNITWHDINPNNNSEINYANFYDLYVYPWLLTMSIFLYRYILEGCIFRSVGHRLGIKDHKAVRPNAELDGVLGKHYRITKTWDKKNILNLSRQTNIPERKGRASKTIRAASITYTVQKLPKICYPILFIICLNILAVWYKMSYI